MARLEDYELGPVLARGGMGAVHEAVERATGRRVAVKRILPQVLDAAAVSRFLLEGKAVARLQHRGIVAVLGAGEADGAPFLVMELVAGESLQRRLDRAGPLSPRDACAMAFEVGEALAHAHARGVLHRDLKPANVLVDEAGRAKLIDFGLAKLAAGAGSLEHLTRTGELVGTPAFMAPEQANGGACDARTDVYGLGATLFTLLTGAPPFSGPSPIGVLQKVLLEPARAPSRVRPGVPPWLDALVLDCLAKEPDARPASAQAVLVRLVGGPGPVERTSRAVPALAALAALALAAGGATVAARRPPATPSAAVEPGAPPASGSRVEPAPARPRVGRLDVEAWPLADLRAAQDEDLERELAPPPPGAGRDEALRRARRLVSAGRCEEARALLSRPPLSGPERDVALLRFEAQADRVERGEGADGRELERALATEPRWAEGLHARALHRARTLTGGDQVGPAVTQLRAAGAPDLAVCLLSEDWLRRDLRAGRDRTAEELLKRLDQEGGESARAHLLRGALRSRILAEPMERVLADAELELTAALERDPYLARGYDLRAEVRTRRLDLTGARSDLRRLAALASDPELRSTALRRAASLPLVAGSYQGILEQLPASPTDDGETERSRADALHHLQRPAEAIATYERLLREALPAEPMAYYLAAGALERLGRTPPDWVERVFALLRRDAPGDWRAWEGALGACAGKSFERSVAELEGELARQPGSLPLLRIRARLLSSAGLHGRALPSCDALLVRAPDDVWDLLLRAAVRSRAKDVAGSQADLERAAAGADAARVEELTSPGASYNEAFFAEVRLPGRFRGLLERLEPRLTGPR